MDVLRCSRYDLSKVAGLILHSSVVQLVGKGDGAKLGHVRVNSDRLRPLVNLSGKVYNLFAVVEHSLVRMVRSYT